MFEVVKTRVGYVSIVRSPRGVIELCGIPVLGQGPKGMINRTVHVWSEAPRWFHELCDDYANTNFKVKVEIVQTQGYSRAYATPMALDKEQAIYEWKLRGSLPPTRKELKESDDYEYVCQVHEIYAAKHGLKVVQHHKDGFSSYTLAEDAEKILYRINGGMIVLKVKSVIDQGRTTLDREIEKFVRMKLAK